MWESDPWSWTGLWHWIGAFNKAILLLLVVMFFHASFVFLERIWKFRKLGEQLPSLLRIVDRTEGAQTIQAAISAAKQNKLNPFARIIIAGLQAFQAAPASFLDEEAIAWAQRAMQRLVALVRERMRAGCSTIATVAALSPFVGLSGTVIGVLNSFRGSTGPRTYHIWRMGNEVSIALVPTVLALFVGVTAYAFYNHLVRSLEIFDTQTTQVTESATNFLSHHSPERHLLLAAEPPVEVPDIHEWEAKYDSHCWVMLAVGLVWLYVVCFLAWGIFWTLTHSQY